MKRIDWFLMRSISIVCIVCNAWSLTLAQGVDSEPNNTCATAQDMGSITLPHMVAGSLNAPPDIPDIDFFHFTGTPGTPVRVNLEGADTGQGTLPDPFLGLFDSDCNVLNFNDDSGTLNARLEFVIPSDGVFILAATSCCDEDFRGAGGSHGSYLMTITPPLPAIGSISGQVVDARTGDPLPGELPPFAIGRPPYSWHNLADRVCAPEHVADKRNNVDRALLQALRRSRGQPHAQPC